MGRRRVKGTDRREAKPAALHVGQPPSSDSGRLSPVNCPSLLRRHYDDTPMLHHTLCTPCSLNVVLQTPFHAPVKAALDVAIHCPVFETGRPKVDELQVATMGALKENVLGLHMQAWDTYTHTHIYSGAGKKTTQHTTGSNTLVPPG